MGPYNDVELFFRNIAPVYGPLINHIGLLYAILASFTAWYDVNDPLRHLRHANSACSVLRRKLNDPATLDEGDLFVSFNMGILSRVMWNYNASTLIEHLFYNFPRIDVPRFSAEETLNFQASNFSTLVRNAPRRNTGYSAKSRRYLYFIDKII